MPAIARNNEAGMDQPIEGYSIVNEDIGNSSEPLWFKFHHYWIEDSPVFANAEYLKLFVWLLARARRKPGHVRLRSGQVVYLDAGECIVGRQAASEALDISPSTFRNRLEKLEAFGAIKTDKKDKAFTRVSIVFPLGLKPKKDKPRTSLGQGEDKPRTSLGQVEDTNKSDKRDQKDEMNNMPQSVSSCDSPTEKEIEDYLQAKYPNLPTGEIQRLSVEVISAIQRGQFKPQHWTGHAIQWAGATEARLRGKPNRVAASQQLQEALKKDSLSKEPSAIQQIQEQLSNQYRPPEKKPWVAELPDSWKGIKGIQ